MSAPPRPATSRDQGLYVHFPYCEKKCPYCDFNSHVIPHDDHRYADAVLREAEAQAATHIVLGSHGHAMVFELLVGSFTQAVLRRSRLPVLVVPVTRVED